MVVVSWKSEGTSEGHRATQKVVSYCILVILGPRCPSLEGPRASYWEWVWWAERRHGTHGITFQPLSSRGARPWVCWTLHVQCCCSRKGAEQALLDLRGGCVSSKRGLLRSSPRTWPIIPELPRLPGRPAQAAVGFPRSPEVSWPPGVSVRVWRLWFPRPLAASIRDLGHLRPLSSDLWPQGSCASASSVSSESPWGCWSPGTYSDMLTRTHTLTSPPPAPRRPGIFLILEDAMIPARVPSWLLSPAISGFLDLMQPRVGLTDSRQRWARRSWNSRSEDGYASPVLCWQSLGRCDVSHGLAMRVGCLVASACWTRVQLHPGEAF